MDLIGNEKKEKKLNKGRVIKTIILGILLILIIVLIAIYSSNEQFRKYTDKYIFRKEIYEEKLPSISLDGISSDNVYSYGNYVAILDQNKLKLYNKYANEDSYVDVEISVPLFRGNGKYLCIAENEGNKIYLVSGKTIIWQKEIEGNISDINVNENGYVSISISGTSYKTVVDVFNNKGEELFKSYLSSTSVIDTDISKDNKYLAIAEANFSGIAVESTIKIISIEKAQNEGKESIIYVYNSDTNDLIVDINYQSKNTLVCMYDSKINYIYQNENKEFSNINMQEDLFVDVGLSGKVAKIVKRSTGLFSTEGKLEIIDVDNKNTFTYSIEDIPKAMYTNNSNVIAINLGTGVLFINNSGWLIKKYNSEQEIEKIVVGDRIAGVISKGKVIVVSL